MTPTPEPTQRLDLSRERLRLAMHCKERPARRDSPASSQPESRSSSTVDWLDSLRALPGAGIVIDAVSQWWQRSPLRLASLVAGDATRTVVRPLAQRHPLGLLVGAVFVGGLFAWSRPWRWMIKPALFAGLLPQIVSSAVAQVPLQAWVTALFDTTAQPKPTAQAESPAARG